MLAVPLAQHYLDLQASLRKQRARATPQSYDIFYDMAAVPGHFASASGGLWDRVKIANDRLLRDIQAYELALEENSALGQLILPVTQFFLTKYGGLGNEQAYLGRDGWLFYRPDIDYATAPGFLEKRALHPGLSANKERVAAEAGRDPRPAILQFHRELAARGIRLILFPTPVKSIAHVDMFSPGGPASRGKMQNRSYDRLVTELQAQGVTVFNADPAIERVQSTTKTRSFLATDTHWRPEIVEAVASDLSRFIRTQADLPPVVAPALKTALDARTGLGDVAKMLRLPGDQTLFRPEHVLLRQILTEAGESWQPAREADVLVLGDSFSNIYSMPDLHWGESAGLVEQLAYELKRPVDAILRNDHGSFATRQMLSDELARGHDRLAGKRVVVWQFAMRELSFGDWKSIPLQLGKKAAGDLLALGDGQQLEVTGVVSEMSPVPRPGKVPYREHLVAVHLVELKGLGGSLAPKSEAVVYVWSMRAAQWTAAARWRPGQQVKLRLESWRAKEATLGRVNRGELDAEQLMLAEPHWGEIIP